jgi:hypothetical protein
MGVTKFDVRGGLLLLYGFSFFGTALDVSMTKTGLMMGAVELNVGARWLLTSFGFDGTALFRFAIFGLLIVVSEFLFRRLLRVDSSDGLTIFAKDLLLGGWLAIFAMACFVVVNNLVILQQISCILIIRI